MDGDKRHVVVRLSGGLGNQLFQLSAGLAATRMMEAGSVFLDTRFLNCYEKQRRLEIEFIAKYFSNVLHGEPEMGFQSMASRLRLGRVMDRQFGPVGLISSANALCRLAGSGCRLLVLDGYFQQPEVLFFEAARIKLRDQLLEECRDMLKQFMMDERPLIGVHIRRGDYVSSKAARSIFRTIPLDYYREAVSKFDSSSQFLIFSDDAAYSDKFSKEVGGLNVSAIGLSLSDEFCLLAACNHYIIANSTFSWWAGYLGHSPNKRLIAPRNWYVDSLRSKANSLLLPYFELMDA